MAFSLKRSRFRFTRWTGFVDDLMISWTARTLKRTSPITVGASTDQIVECGPPPLITANGSAAASCAKSQVPTQTLDFSYISFPCWPYCISLISHHSVYKSPRSSIAYETGSRKIKGPRNWHILSPSYFFDPNSLKSVKLKETGVDLKTDFHDSFVENFTEIYDGFPFGLILDIRLKATAPLTQFSNNKP